MLQGYNDFKAQFDNKSISFKINNQLFDKTIRSFAFLLILKKESFDSEIFNAIKRSKLIVADYKSNDEYYIICFEGNLIIIDQSDQRFKEILTKEVKNKIHYVPENKPNSNLDIFRNEINKFSEKFTINSKSLSINNFWKIIRRCLSGYLIKESYLRCNINRVKEFKNEKIEPKIFKENEFINLREIESTQSSRVSLFYHIDTNKLFAVKSFFLSDDNDKLKDREISNYQSLNYPFLPKYFGVIKYGDFDSIVIEFINGEMINESLICKLIFKEKLKLIIEILYTIQYLHKNDFLYRDFKLNNLMLDKKCNIILIDFDRMIKYNNDDLKTDYTKDFKSPFVDENINTENYIPSFKNDICSIGKLIKCIFIENDNNIKNSIKTEIVDIYSKCLNVTQDDEKRILSDIIFCFCNLIIVNNVSLSDMIDDFIFFANQNDSIAQTFLGILYLNGKEIKKDIDKAIYYFTLAADQNNEFAQFNLGQIYSNNAFKRQDFSKAIHYYTLAADQNNPNAQNILGNMYLDNKYIKQNINKAIHYFSLAAKQNQPIALVNLGFFYFEGKYVARDMQKAIHYFSLAAEQNDPQAQHFLGLFYSKKEFNMIDIDKAIQYFKLASDQNLPESQFNLGQIYLNNKYIKRDINKSIYYFQLAAKQNHEKAQFYLGMIYLNGKYIEKDINKAVHFLTLAANQNEKNSQNTLGYIFYEGKYVKQDINKAIYYLTQSASQNFSLALNNLGFIFYEGKYVKQDIDKAIYYLTLSAKQNLPFAINNLAIIYLKNKKDINKAIQLFQLAANQNYPNAQDNLGFLYYEGKYVQRDIDKAIFYFSQAANQSFPLSQNNIGIIYYEGKYIARDVNKAIYYLQLAANQNFLLAQENLGKIYYEGKFITRDIDKSIFYLTLASNQNSPEAQNILGLIFIEGKYIQRNVHKSIYYFTLAANQDYADAQNNLGFIYYDCKFIPQDMNKAIYYLTKAAIKNFPIAQFNLGFIYYEGKYVPRNIRKAFFYLESSSEQDFRDAQLLLGDIYLEGKYIKRDIQKVIRLYKEVSNLNNQFAKNNLGVIFKNGIDNINKNIFLAKEYFKEAINQKNDFLSMFNLANILIDEEEQSGKDYNESIQYLIKSSQKFYPSLILFYILLIKKNGYINSEIIEDELKKQNLHTNSIKSFIFQKNDVFEKPKTILLDSNGIEKMYQDLRNSDYIYINKKIVKLNEITAQLSFNINDQFYEGFLND